MATKRQPSKQRRQTQNQRQRAALEARRANAAAAGAVPEGKVGGGGSAGSPSGGGGSLLSRLRGSAATGRAARTGTPVGSQPVGHRAALAGLLAAVAGAVVGALLISVPVDGNGDPVTTVGAMAGEWTLSASEALRDDPDATAEELAGAVEDWAPNGEEPYAKATFPLSLFLLLPIVGSGLAFRAVSKRAPARVVNRTMYVTLFGTLLSGQLAIFLPTVVGVGIAAFQVRKAELQAAAGAAEDAGGEPVGDGDVIDVAEVEADEVEADEVEADEVEADELAEDDAFLDAEEGADEEDPQRSV